MRELAVIRQQERSGRVRVEPADGDDAHVVRYEIDHCRAAFRVVRGSDDAGRLVQEHVAEGLSFYPLPVDLDGVVLADGRVQLPGLSVHLHTPFEDQFVGTSSRGDARAREECIQPHPTILV